jgi:hypothetical protein
MTKKFNVRNLSLEAQKLYDEIVKDKMHLGDTLTMIDLMFKKFERPSNIDEMPKISGYNHDYLVFTEKLKALDR